MEIQDLNSDETQDLIKFILNFIKEFRLNLEPVCISFHTGKWASSPEFHAHICISQETYLKMFIDSNLNMELIKPTSNWNLKSFTEKITNMLDLYIENVKFYRQACIQSGIKYRKKEIESIKTELEQNFLFIPSKISNIRLDFDLWEPKLKFIYTSLDSNISQQNVCISLLKEMCYFSNKFGFLQKPSGCHICISIDLNNNCYGYIHLSADKYFQLHPLPSIFLDNFKRIENYSVET